MSDEESKRKRRKKPAKAAGREDSASQSLYDDSPFDLCYRDQSFGNVDEILGQVDGSLRDAILGELVPGARRGRY